MIKNFLDLNNGSFVIKGCIKNIESYALQEGSALKMQYNIEIENSDGDISCYYLKNDVLNININDMKDKEIFSVIDKENNILSIEEKLSVDVSKPKFNHSHITKKVGEITISSAILFGLSCILLAVMFKTGEIDTNNFINGLIISFPLFILSIFALFFTMNKDINYFEEELNTRKKIIEWVYDDQESILENEVKKNDLIKV